MASCYRGVPNLPGEQQPLCRRQARIHNRSSGSEPHRFASGDPPHPHVARCAGAAMEVTMTLVDIALWFILAALIAIVPIGCVMTRSGKSSRHAAPE
jgi:hypothetical protein